MVLVHYGTNVQIYNQYKSGHSYALNIEHSNFEIWLVKVISCIVGWERGTKRKRTYIHNKIWCARPENRFGFVYHLLDILNSFRSSTSWGSWEFKGKQKFPIFRVIVCVTSSVRRGRKRSHGKIDFFGTFYEAREGATLLGYWRSKGDLTAVSLDNMQDPRL